jgi:hypothetical protein
MNKYWKSLGTGLVAGALLLTGTTSGITGAEVASAATPAKLTVEQAFGKLTASAKALKSFHLDSTKSLDLLLEGEHYPNTDFVDLDINRSPKFAAMGSVSDLDGFSIDLYANDNEFYTLLDGSLLMDDYEEDDTASGDLEENAFDPDSEYWVESEKFVWDTIYTKSQYDPAYILDLVKNYKKSMKVTETGSQAVLTLTVTEPNAAKSIIKVYDNDMVDGLTTQPKSVTWKLYANKKTWQIEKLAVTLNYVLIEDGEKMTVNTKVDAKYTNHNKVATIVKPAEIE